MRSKLTLLLFPIGLTVLVSCSKNKEADWNCACPKVWSEPDSSGISGGYYEETYRYEYVTKDVAKSRCDEETRRRQQVEPDAKCVLSKL